MAAVGELRIWGYSKTNPQGGEPGDGQEGRRGHGGGGQAAGGSGGHGGLLPTGQAGRWCWVVIQAARMLSGWSARWSRTRASRRSSSWARCAAVMATSWRSRVVVAVAAALARSSLLSWLTSAAATSTVGARAVLARTWSRARAAGAPAGSG